MAIVYLVFNEVTEKYYVGQTVESLLTRWRKHKDQALHGRPTRIGKVIRKYGSESFSLQILSKPVSKESLNNTERLWIVLLQSTNENFGYNITSGGESVVITEESIFKMRKSLTGRKLSDEHKRNIAESVKRRWSNPEYKARLSEKISKALAGKPKSKYHRKQMSEGRIGMKLSPLHIQHIQEGRKQFFARQKENAHVPETY